MRPTGLLDRSRAPHDHPNATPRELAERIVEASAHPTWGPILPPKEVEHSRRVMDAIDPSRFSPR